MVIKRITEDLTLAVDKVVALVLTESTYHDDKANLEVTIDGTYVNVYGTTEELRHIKNKIESEMVMYEGVYGNNLRTDLR